MKYQYNGKDIVSALNMLNTLSVEGIKNIGVVMQVFNILNNPIDKIQEENNNEE